MRFFITFLCGVCSFFYTCATPNILTIRVKSDTLTLPYASLRLNKIHYLADKNGVFLLDKSKIRTNDTLSISYMGFESKNIGVTANLLKQDSLIVFLAEKSYLLDEVVIAKKINGLKYFLKQKKNMLLPYIQPIKVDVRCGNEESHYTVRKGIVEIDSVRMLHDAKGGKIDLEQMVWNTIIVADWFCLKSKLKKFDCSYKGKDKDRTIWKFKAKKTQQGTLLIDSEQNEELISIVTLDKKGVISRIKTFVVKTKDNENINSSISDIEYTMYKGQLIAKRLLWQGAEKGENNEFVIDFYNYRRK